MLSVSIAIDPAQIDEIRNLLKPRQFKQAMQRAVSLTITTGTALIARRIGEEINTRTFGIGKIKKTIDAKRGSYDKPHGSISVSRDRAIWLTEFMTASQATPKLRKSKDGGFVQKQRKGGIRVNVRRKPTPKYPTTEVHPHAFLQYAIAPKPGAFERFGPKVLMQKGKYRGKMRQKIRRKRGPTPIGVFINARGERGARTVLEEATRTLGDTLAKNLNSQLNRFLNPRATDKVANA